MGSELRGIGMGLCIIGVMLEVFLEIELEKPTNFFKNHPTVYEICVHLMVVAMPVGLAVSALQRWALSIPDVILGSLIITAIVWPFIMYGIHNKMSEHAVTLGITSKGGREK